MLNPELIMLGGTRTQLMDAQRGPWILLYMMREKCDLIPCNSEQCTQIELMPLFTGHENDTWTWKHT